MTSAILQSEPAEPVSSEIKLILKLGTKHTAQSLNTNQMELQDPPPAMDYVVSQQPKRL